MIIFLASLYAPASAHDHFLGLGDQYSGSFRAKLNLNDHFSGLFHVKLHFDDLFSGVHDHFLGLQWLFFASTYYMPRINKHQTKT